MIARESEREREKGRKRGREEGREDGRDKGENETCLFGHDLTITIGKSEAAGCRGEGVRLQCERRPDRNEAVLSIARQSTDYHRCAGRGYAKEKGKGKGKGKER